MGSDKLELESIHTFEDEVKVGDVLWRYASPATDPNATKPIEKGIFAGFIKCRFAGRCVHKHCKGRVLLENNHYGNGHCGRSTLHARTKFIIVEKQQFLTDKDFEL